MRIEANQRIAGYPALQVRQLMRKVGTDYITLQCVREVLNCSELSASTVLGHLQELGFVQPIEHGLGRSLKGNALALASAAPPLQRRTAERLLTEVIARAKSINKNSRLTYRVARLVLFGSYLKDVDRLSDVDIACKLLPRWTGAKQGEQEQLRRRMKEGRFRNPVEWAFWPQYEVARFLKSGSRGLSLHELDEWVLATDHKVVFEDADDQIANA
jgi:predicted nucleotidyltransferase